LEEIDIGQWLRTDETSEAVLGLEMVSEQLYKIRNNHYHWKWAIIALHNSFQGFMVLALQGSNGLNIVTDKCSKEWLLAYEQKCCLYPERKLEPFLGLYKRIKSKRMLQHTLSKRFEPRGNQNNNVRN